MANRKMKSNRGFLDFGRINTLGKRTFLFNMLLIGFVLLGLAACSGETAVPEVVEAAPVATATTPATATSAPIEPTATAMPSGQPFTSERFGYTLEYPAGWIAKENLGEWPDFQSLIELGLTPGIDTFSGYIDRRILVMGIAARELSDGESLDDWVVTADDLTQSSLNIINVPICLTVIEDGMEPVVRDEITLGGEPAVLSEYFCSYESDFFNLIVLAVHDGQGYWITWRTPKGEEEADRAQFAQVLSTFEFVEP